jgi:hypothetical protein
MKKGKEAGKEDNAGNDHIGEEHSMLHMQQEILKDGSFETASVAA